MAIYQHTLIFDGPGHGWQESLYFRRSSQDVDAALAWVSPAIVDKRKEMLGSQFSVKAERVTMVYNNANQHVRRVSTRSKFFKVSSQNQQGEDTTTSLQVLMQNSTKDKSKLTFLAGPYAGVNPFANAYDPCFGGVASFFN